MSTLNKCLRFSWDVAKSPNHSWGGTNDRTVESMVKSRLTNLTEDYKDELKVNSSKGYQLSVPLIMLLRNTKHPMINERNFFWGENQETSEYYPKDWGEFLTTEERDTIQKKLKIKPEHRFVLYMADDYQQETSFTSKLVMTHAFTTYTIPSVLSLNDLASIIATNSFGSNDPEIASLTSSPLLIITDVFGACEDLRKAVGAITSMLKERMCNGRLTVFIDSGHLHCDEETTVPQEKVSAYNQTKSSLAKFLRDNTTGVSVLNSPLTAFLFGGMTYVMNEMSFVKGKHTSIE